MAPEPPSKDSEIASSQDRHYNLTKERSWLLPYNRRLRSLTGISVRNLTLSPLPGRSRGQTIDDDSLPTTLQTTAKLLAKREQHKLEHSRSSDDLKSQSSADGSSKSTALGSQTATTNVRPLKERLRRRSTLNWTNASAETRQQKLEEATSERLLDTWFSLHVDGLTEPVYISEIVERSMNASFNFFDLNIYGPIVTRRQELTLKIWARSQSTSDFLLLIELRVNLQSLQFIGKSLENFHHPLPPNCVLFHLADGIYTSFTDLPYEETTVRSRVPLRESQPVQPASSFDALMRLSNLDDCIQDALATREKLSSQIGKLLEEQKASRDSIDDAAQAEEDLAFANQAVVNCRKQVQAAKSKRAALIASLQSRRAAIANGKEAQEHSQAQLMVSTTKLSEAVERNQSTKSALSGQIRRICEDLLTIYPIEPIDPKSLSYTIRDIQLPNANTIAPHSESDPASMSAALGLAAHIVQLLSLYLSVPIPYPPTFCGSTSTIYDPISTSMPSAAARTFPLYQTGAVTYRFEYGVFLLNTDIELLMSRQGAKIVDLRHTLPNLKYILTVLTAGKGALPTRKKGGIRLLENGKPPGGSKELPKDEEREKLGLGNGKAIPQDSIL